MTNESKAALGGVRALADSVACEPDTRIKWTDADICSWSISAPAYEHVEVPDMLIGVLTCGDVRWNTKSNVRSGCFRRGRIAIIPSATRLSMRPVSPLRATTIHVSPECMNRIFEINDGAAVLQSTSLKLGLNAPLIAMSLSALAEELRNPSEHGSIFTESVVTSLLHQAVFASNKPPRRRAVSGLSPNMLRRIQDYIAAELASPMCLNDLACIAGLSQFYFCKAFKVETGLAPHQYIINERIKRSKDLLRNSNSNLADIALDAGFSSHSHMTTTFQKIVGVSPAFYRRSIQ